MKYIFLATALGVAATAATPSIAACDVSTIKGDYGFQAEGTRLSDGNEVPYHAVRSANFDGISKTGGKGVAIIDGKAVDYTLSGTYTVNADCHLSLRLRRPTAVAAARLLHISNLASLHVAAMKYCPS